VERKVEITRTHGAGAVAAAVERRRSGSRGILGVYYMIS
jgi:hypothetical protein